MPEQRDFRLGDKVSIDGRFPAVTVTGFRRLNGRETYRVEDADGETHEWIKAYRLSIWEEAPETKPVSEWQPLDSASDALPWIGSQVDIRDEGGRLHTGKLLMVQAEETTTTLILSGEVSVRTSDGLCIRDSRPFQDIDTHTRRRLR